MPETHTIVVRLVHLVIETGVLTGMFRCPTHLRTSIDDVTPPHHPATAATIDLILFLRFPGDSFHAAVAFSLAKLYSNSLLVLFNNRTQFKHHPKSNQFSLSGTAVSRSGGSANVNLPKDVIHVEQSTFVDVEDGDIPLEDRVRLPGFVGTMRLSTFFANRLSRRGLVCLPTSDQTYAPLFPAFIGGYQSRWVVNYASGNAPLTPASPRSTDTFTGNEPLMPKN